MSKICILGDTHFGVKQGDQFLAEYQVKFFEKVLFPYLKEHNIKQVLQLGDWFDSRRAIRHSTMELVRKRIIPQIQAEDQHWHVLVGNHDMGVRENINPNACTELLSSYDCFTVVDSPRTVTLEGFDIDLIPWLCKSNRKEVRDFIKDSKTAYCAGHFELTGFYFYKGIKSDGVSKKFLDDYHQVWSGHFHTISANGNIQYMGTPYQLTFGDADDDRGFWIFDTETKEIEFVKNPYGLYTKIYYDAESFNKKNLIRFKDMHVKIIVEQRGEAAAFDMLLNDIAKHAQSLDVIDTFDNPEEDGLEIDVSDTLKIMSDYINELDESGKDKKRVNGIVSTLYREAMNED